LVVYTVRNAKIRAVTAFPGFGRLFWRDPDEEEAGQTHHCTEV